MELAERARLVLQAESGGSPAQVAANLGLSPQTVEGVLSQFETDRLAAFPRPSLRLSQLTQLDPAGTASRRHVAHLARRLFNETRPLHHLPRRARRLLEASALLPPVTGASNNNHGAAHETDVLEGADLADCDPREQMIISVVLHLQHKGYRTDRDPLFRQLRPSEQSQVRHLAALLQVAAALDHSRTQTTTLEAVAIQTKSVRLYLAGDSAQADGRYGCRQARFWQPVFHLALECTVGPRPKSLAEKPRPVTAIERDETIGTAFGKELAAALRKWPATLPGADSSGISNWGDLLAAVTEATAALGAFASVLKRQPVKKVKRPLRELARLLSAVVEQENALGDLDAYCSGRPPAVVAGLQPLREAWERAGRRKQAALKTWLESEDATRLYTLLHDMAHSAPIRRRKSARLRVAAAVLLDELSTDVAEREAEVVADLPDTYRQYQRSLARLASALEALDGKGSSAGKLGADVDLLRADLLRLQSRIDRWLASSALNTAIAEFLDAWAEQQARRKAPQLYGAQPVLAYRQARRAQWSRLRGSLPSDWRPVRASRLRRRVDSLLKQLERD